MSPSIFWTIATVMVVLATVAVVAPLFWVRAGSDEQFGKRRLLAVVALAAGIPLVALSIYSVLGSPLLVGAPVPAVAAAIGADALPHAATDPSRPGQAAGDMGAAIARLEARLATAPNDAAGWQLLAQSYEFVGRAADAANARARASGGGGAGPAPAGASLIGAAAAMPGAAPATVAGAGAADPLANTAESARRARDFPRAIDAFKQLVKRGAMSADLWADYADAVGAQRGTLDELSEPMITKALALDPNHVKALWLLGSLQTQRNDARGALATWQKLAQLVPATSSDAKLIAANMREARAATGTAPVAAVRAVGISLRGQVQLDPRWRSRVTPDTVLFIFAKSLDQPGPPLAVFRTTAARWPVDFILDDSMAMMPNRKLSDFQKVVVEARLSRSGSANPSKGDLRGSTATLDPHRSSAPLKIVIVDEIG